jgi:hypothetical protein
MPGKVLFVTEESISVHKRMPERSAAAPASPANTAITSLTGSFRPTAAKPANAVRSSGSGRITKPGERYQPKTGVARMAFATGSPIVPFYLTGTERIFADRRPRLVRRVRVVFGEPIAVTQLEKPDASRPRDSDQPRGQRQ